MRVTQLTPVKDKALVKLPDLTGPEPMSLATRAAMTVAVVPLEHHTTQEAMRKTLIEGLRYEAMFDLIVYEALASADKVPHLNQDVELWMHLPPQAGAVQSKNAALKLVPAQEKIARKVVRGSWADVPDQMVHFIGEVTAAGHKLAPGPTVVRHITGGDDAGGTLVELQVPIAGK